ncbi:MAG: FadR family transcriptional regulator [Hyphomicrobiales bacterium]|nr:FadR family transcriptional regulator [Hyphomicrobiales bacterium]
MPGAKRMGIPALWRATNVRARAREQIARVRSTIEQTIDQGRVKPGERIAAERELAEQFGASRSVVRAALAELHSAGKIVRRVGHGTIVQAAPTALHAEAFALRDTSPSELLEFRLALEPGLAEAITLNASEVDLKLIMETVERGDRANGWEQWEHWDRTFHRNLVAATHNRLAIGVYDAVIGIRHERPWLKIKQGHTNATFWRGYQDEHHKIAAALMDRNAQAAAEAIRDHLTKVRIKMLGP